MKYLDKTINNAIEFAVLSQIVMWKETTRW